MGLVRGALLPAAAQCWLQLMLGICCMVLLTTLFRLEIHWKTGEGDATSKAVADVAAYGPTLVSYSYFEMDDIQRANMEFFMAVGMVSWVAGFLVDTCVQFRQRTLMTVT